MHLQLLFPKVNPSKRPVPTTCTFSDCSGKRFRFHQPVAKSLRDTIHQQVEAHRYQCLKCGRTFRVYPEGVTSAQTSQRVKGLAVLLYLLGLSYGAVSLALEAIGVSLSKTHVYNTVQEAAKRVPGLKREQVFEGITVDAISGLALSIDALSGEDMQTLKV